MMMLWNFKGLFSGTGLSLPENGILELLIIAPLILFFLFLKREGVFGSRFDRPGSKTAKESLAEKLVSGDITETEYENKLKLLEKLDD